MSALDVVMSGDGELLVLPDIRQRGRKGRVQQTIYDKFLKGMCAAIRAIQATLNFRVSARGWCYLLEDYGVPKGAFDWAAEQITVCRKRGLLPLDIVADDDARACEHLQKLHGAPEDMAAELLDYILSWRTSTARRHSGTASQSILRCGSRKST